MKTSLSTLCALLVILGVSLSAKGAPIAGNPNSGAYLMPAPDLSRWSGGVYVHARVRNVNVGGVHLPLYSKRTAGYLGFDVLSWLTVYGTLVDGSHKVGYGTTSGNNEYGGGVLLSLLNDEIFAPTVLEDVLRLNATIQYTEGDIFLFNKSVPFHEVYGALTLHIINEIDGNKLYWPDAIGLFIGPVYSTVKADNLREEQSAGFNLGLEFFFTDRITMNFGTEQIDAQNKYLYGLHIRF